MARTRCNWKNHARPQVNRQLAGDLESTFIVGENLYKISPASQIRGFLTLRFRDHGQCCGAPGLEIERTFCEFGTAFLCDFDGCIHKAVLDGQCLQCRPNLPSLCEFGILHDGALEQGISDIKTLSRVNRVHRRPVFR